MCAFKVWGEFVGMQKKLSVRSNQDSYPGDRYGKTLSSYLVLIQA